MIAVLRFVDLLLYSILGSFFVYLSPYLDNLEGWRKISLITLYFLVFLIALRLKTKLMIKAFKKYKKQ